MSDMVALVSAREQSDCMHNFSVPGVILAVVSESVGAGGYSKWPEIIGIRTRTGSVPHGESILNRRQRAASRGGHVQIIKSGRNAGHRRTTAIGCR